MQSLSRVVAYKEVHGNCNVPRKWKKDPTLGEWVHFQRRQYRLKQLNRRNHMTEERIQKLEAIGFEWSRGTQAHYPYQKGVHVYLERPEDLPQQPDGPIQIPLENESEQIMVEYNIECREQAQQIADVVEQHVASSEPQIPINHEEHETMEVKKENNHIYEAEEIQGKGDELPNADILSEEDGKECDMVLPV